MTYPKDPVISDPDPMRENALAGYWRRARALGVLSAIFTMQLCADHAYGAQAASKVHVPRAAINMPMPGGVDAIAISPDESIVAVASNEELYLLDGPSARVLYLLKSKGQFGITQLKFSADGHRLLSISVDGTVELWDPVNARFVHRISEGDVSSLCGASFASSGKEIALCYDGNIRLVDVGTNATVAKRTLTGERTVLGKRMVWLSPDSTAAVLVDFSSVSTDAMFVSTNPGDRRKFDLCKEAAPGAEGSKSISGVSVSSKGQYLVVACHGFLAPDEQGDSLYVWDLKTFQIKARKKIKERAYRLYFTSQDDVLILNASGADTLRATDLGTVSHVKNTNFSVGPQAINASSTAVVANAIYGIERVSLVGNKRKPKIVDQARVIGSIAFDRQDRLISINDLDEATSWDFSKGVVQRIFRFDGRTSLSKDGSLVAGWVVHTNQIVVIAVATRQVQSRIDWAEPKCRKAQSASVVATSINDSATRIAILRRYDADTTESKPQGQEESCIAVYDAKTGALLEVLPGPPTSWPVRMKTYLDDILAIGNWRDEGDFVANLSASSTETPRLLGVGGHDTVLDGSKASNRLLIRSPIDRQGQSALGERSANLDDPAREGHLDFAAAISAASRSPDGRLTAVALADGDIELFDDAGQDEPSSSRRVPEGRAKEISVLKAHRAAVSALAFSNDGNFLASAAIDGSVVLWRTKDGAQMGSIFSFEDSRWVALRPNGEFDSNDLNSLNAVSWTFDSSSPRVLPLESFTREFYKPGLLSSFRAPVSKSPKVRLESLNRIAPRVSVAAITENSQPRDTVTLKVSVSGIEGQRDPFSASQLRVFRTGRLIPTETYLRTDQGQQPGKASFVIKNVAVSEGEAGSIVTFSSYAFNSDGIKGETDLLDFERRAGRAVRKRRAVIISVGVEEYADPSLNTLNYAAADALWISESLATNLREVGAFQSIEPVLLVSGREAHEGTKPATRSNFLSALESVGIAHRGPTSREPPKNAALRPDDMLVLYFSGHASATQDGGFDLLLAGSSAIGDPDGRVSSEELKDLLVNVDAQDIVVILDACESGAAVGPDFRPAPLGARSFGQVAYDKKIRFLAATKQDDRAFESASLKHGYLTYALVHEGLELHLADTQPTNRSITIGKWLLFASERVPELIDEDLMGQQSSIPSRPNMGPVDGPTIDLQTPVLFDFASRDERLDALLWKGAAKN